MKKIILLSILLNSYFCSFSQDNLSDKYRAMALNYNYDLKSAQRNIESSIELEKMASASLKPSLAGNANFKYIGNPTELNFSLPIMDEPLGFKGQHSNYGAGITIFQPIYTGGKLLESLKKAQYQHSLSENQKQIIVSSVCSQTDFQYWNTVARNEVVGISEEYKNSVKSLVKTIKERVDAGLINTQDLLMAEVKLNEAEYNLLQAKNNFDIGRMALNSMIGVNLSDNTEIQNEVPIIIADPNLWDYNNIRPEIEAAQSNIQIAKSNLKITNSKYLPQLSIGAEGTYGKPGYDFKPDLDPNYGVYAKLSVPIFEWGKRRNEKKISLYQVGIAEDNLYKTKDKVNLETQTARISLSQSLQRVELAESSLHKAMENEKKATERYMAGEITIIEVIDAQVYRMNTQINFTEAKVNAQSSYVQLIKALNLYGSDGNIISLYK